MSRALLFRIPGWPALSVACVILSFVRPGKRPFKRPLPNFVADFCSPLFLEDGMAVHSQVVDAAHSHTLSEEGKFRLWVLAELDAIVHCSNDVCFAQELVRYVLSRSDSDSECDASRGSCGDFGHVLHVADPPLKSRCIQVVHVVDDFCFSGGSAPLRSAPTLRWRRRIPAGKPAPRSGDT